MKPVNQRIISDVDGDCFDACMVSILELADFPTWSRKTNQYIRWNEFLDKHNMQVLYYELGTFPVPDGFAIMSVKSALFAGARHAVVVEGNGWTVKIVHNPNPQDPRGIEIPSEDWFGFSFVALKDPAKNIKE